LPDETTPADGAEVPSGWISKNDLEKRKDGISVRLSDKVRALALGVLAFVWAVFSADKPPVSLINATHHKWLLWSGVLAVLSLLFDLLNSLGNFIESDNLLRKIDRDKQDAGQFDYKTLVHRGQGWAFHIKIIFAIGSCLSLLVLLYRVI
jgi:hypothetical protein